MVSMVSDVSSVKTGATITSDATVSLTDVHADFASLHANNGELFNLFLCYALLTVLMFSRC